MESVEDCFIGGDKRRFVAVATGQVLWGDDRNSISGFGTHQQNFAVIVGKIRALDNLSDKRPKFQRLVGRLVVEHKVNPAYALILCDEE